jgi:hypothetical protein
LSSSTSWFWGCGSVFGAISSMSVFSEEAILIDNKWEVQGFQTRTKHKALRWNQGQWFIFQVCFPNLRDRKFLRGCMGGEVEY